MQKIYIKTVKNTRNYQQYLNTGRLPWVKVCSAEIPEDVGVFLQLSGVTSIAERCTSIHEDHTSITYELNEELFDQLVEQYELEESYSRMPERKYRKLDQWEEYEHALITGDFSNTHWLWYIENEMYLDIADPDSNTHYLWEEHNLAVQQQEDITDEEYDLLCEKANLEEELKLQQWGQMIARL